MPLINAKPFHILITLDWYSVANTPLHKCPEHWVHRFPLCTLAVVCSVVPAVASSCIQKHQSTAWWSRCNSAGAMLHLRNHDKFELVDEHRYNQDTFPSQHQPIAAVTWWSDPVRTRNSMHRLDWCCSRNSLQRHRSRLLQIVLDCVCSHVCNGIAVPWCVRADFDDTSQQVPL